MTFMSTSLRVLKNLKDVPYDRFLGLVSYKISDADTDYSHIKRRKTKLELCLLSACVCGIEFCYAAETAFVSPTLLQIGVPVIYMTLVWCLSPLLGFFLVPLLGSLSDRCRSKLGRRRPFILFLSCGIVLGLILVPEGKSIGKLLGDVYEVHRPSLDDMLMASTVSNALNDSDYRDVSTRETVASTTLYDVTTYDDVTVTTIMASIGRRLTHPWSIFFTVIGVVMLDFSCDACQSPCRAYMLDVTTPEDHPVGLSTFTVLAGLGGSLGYIFGGIHWGSTEIGPFGSQIRIVFSIVLVLYIICLTLTMISIKEIPLEKLGIGEEELQRKRKKKGGAKYRRFTNEEDSLENEADEGKTKNYGSQLETSLSETEKGIPNNVPNGYPSTPRQSEEDAAVDDMNCNQVDKEKTHEESKDPLPEHEGLPMAAEVSLKLYLKSIVQMPKSLAFLCLTNLFCWMSLVCYSLYFTDFVGQAVYHGDPSAPEGSPEHTVYEEGVRMGSFGMALYSISCSFYSLSIEKLVKTFGAKRVYIYSQLVYTVGSLILALWRHQVAVILLSPTAGVMYATLFTMPYLLVAHYHSNDTFEELVPGAKKSHQVRGLGTDVALVSSMVFVAQFLLSSCMGSIVHATGSTVAVVVTASLLSLCGAIAATQVLYLDL